MTPSHQDVRPGSFTTWQRLIPFGLQRFSRGGQTQHPLRVADSQVCTHIAARGACECVSTLAGRQGLAIHRLSSWERERLPDIPPPGDSAPPTCEPAPAFCSRGRRPLRLHPLRLGVFTPILPPAPCSFGPRKREHAPHREGSPGQGWRVAHPSSAPSTPKPSQGNKRKKEVSYLSRVAFVWFAEMRRCP